jgi:hypothetical protein
MPLPKPPTGMPTPPVADDLLGILLRIERKIDDMPNHLEVIRKEVAKNHDLTKSVHALVQGLKAQLDAAIEAGDPAALKELSADLSAHGDQLAAAVSENTPADPNKAKPAYEPGKDDPGKKFSADHRTELKDHEKSQPSSDPKQDDTKPSGKSDPKR